MIKRSAVLEKAAVLKLAQIIVQRQSVSLADTEALIAPEAFEVWASGMKYGAEQVVRHSGGLYRVVQAVDKSQAHQAPDAGGMLAVYRPIVPTASGSADDPIPFIYGMDCVAGLCYKYQGGLYLCKGDMLPCVWYPDATIWQWENTSIGVEL